MKLGYPHAFVGNIIKTDIFSQSGIGNRVSGSIEDYKESNFFDTNILSNQEESDLGQVSGFMNRYIEILEDEVEKETKGSYEKLKALVIKLLNKGLYFKFVDLNKQKNMKKLLTFI